MPPKCLVHVQTLRDTYGDNEASTVVVNWATETVGQLLQLAQQAAAQCATMKTMTYTSANAEKTPESVVQVLEQLQSLCRCIYSDAEIVRTVISVRIPEIKEEDNLGVRVQHDVLKLIDDIENKILGESSERKGALLKAGIFAIREYTKARGEVEESILGKPEEGKGAKNGSRSPTRLLDLREVDVEFMLKVEMAAMQLATALRTFISAYGINRKKLFQPRTGTDHMVS